jgi:hypothetical protein
MVATRNPMEVPTMGPLMMRLSRKQRQRLSSICIALFCADDLIKPHGSIWVVRRWCDMCTDPIRGCFNNPEGLSNGHLPSERGPQVRELANSLKLGIVVPSQDLSGA